MPQPRPRTTDLRRDFPFLALFAGGVLGFMVWASFQMPLSSSGRIAAWSVAGLASLLVIYGLWGVLRPRARDAALTDQSRPSRAREMALLAVALVVALALAIVPAPGIWGWLTLVGTLLAVLAALYLGLRIARQGTSALYRQALLLDQEGDHTAALARLDTLLTERPGDAAALQLRVIIHRQAGRHELAHRAAQDLVDAHPSLALGYAERGLTFLAQKDPASACEPLQQAAELAPNLAEAHYNLGLALVETDESRGAIAPLERALALGLADDADRLVAWYHLYRAYLDADQSQAADKALRQIRRRKGVLRRWRNALRDAGGSGAASAAELALIAEIERLI